MRNMIGQTNNATKNIDQTTRDLFTYDFTENNDSAHPNLMNMQNKVKDAILQQSNHRKQKLLKKLYYLYYKKKI